MPNHFTIFALSTNVKPHSCAHSVDGAGVVMHCAKCDATLCVLMGKYTQYWRCLAIDTRPLFLTELAGATD